MFDLGSIEVVLMLMLLSGVFAGVFLAVRLAHRSSPTNES